jgi:fucose permease
LLLFAMTPTWFADPYHGLVLGTIVFSMGAGILEMLLSPLVNAVPSERKEADMSMLHAYYAIGWMGVLVGTTVGLLLLGESRWRWIVLAWVIFPLLTALGFAIARVPELVHESKRTKLRDLIRKPAYVACVLAIGLAGATELAMAQWASAFAEQALRFPKLVGDMIGVGLFAAGLGAGRIWHGTSGSNVPIRKVMMIGCTAAIILYVVTALSPLPWLSLVACALTGFATSLLWPGMLSISAGRFPLAGASMFAAMSAAGDFGGAVVPWGVGVIADQSSLRMGLLAATVCPLLMLILLLALRPAPATSLGNPDTYKPA